MRTLVLVSISALLMITGLAPVAQAASTQRICSSSASKTEWRMDFKNGASYVRMYPGECVDVGRGSTIISIGNGYHGYRVGYNLGPYSSDCRNNSGFTPWTKADVIYFKSYDRWDCTNY